MAAGSTVTYIVEKRTDSWKFSYRSAVDSDLHVADCDAYLNYEYIAMDEAFKASLAGHIGGHFVKLERFPTYYRRTKPYIGAQLVLVHDSFILSHIGDTSYRKATARSLSMAYGSFGRG